MMVYLPNSYAQYTANWSLCLDDGNYVCTECHEVTLDICACYGCKVRIHKDCEVLSVYGPTFILCSDCAESD